MAFSPTTATATREGMAGPLTSAYQVTVAYLEADTSNEIVVSGVPEIGTLRRITDDRADGTGTERTIYVHTATAKGGDTVYESTTTAVATAIDDKPGGFYRCDTAGTLYVTIEYDAAADNDGTLVLFFEDGWVY